MNDENMQVTGERNAFFDVEFGKITRYRGNYQTYLVKKAMMMENYERQYASNQKERAKLEEYIQKNKVKTSTARQAKSREKMLERIEVMDAPQSADIKLNLYFEQQLATKLHAKYNSH